MYDIGPARVSTSSAATLDFTKKVYKFLEKKVSKLLKKVSKKYKLASTYSDL